MGVFKRPNRDGSFTWYARYQYKRKDHWEAAGTTKRAADLLLAKRKLEISQGVFDVPENPDRPIPFCDYFPEWLVSYAKTHVKSSTFHLYETAYRLYLLPEFQEQDIREIERKDIQRVLLRLQGQGKTRATIKAYLAPLSEMFNWAIEHGLLDRNPCWRVLRTARKDVVARQRAIRVLKRPELKHLLDTCEEYYPAQFPFVLLLARTGVRIGEGVVVRWEDVALEQRDVWIRRNFVDGILEDSTKGGRDRHISLSQQLAEVLAVHRAETASQWAFPNQAGNFYNPDTYRKRQWRRVVETAGFPQLLPKHLRHTFATHLLQQGTPIAQVQKLMGHQSIRTTVDTYGHLVPSESHQDVDQLDR